MSERPAIDPRYDPRFQRGFQAPPPTPVERFEAFAVAEPPSDPVAEPPVGAVEPRTPARQAAEPAPPSVSGGIDEPIPLNPWALVLLIVSLVMIGAGLALSWQQAVLSTQPNGFSWTSETPMIEVFVQQLLWVLPNTLVMVGAAGVVLRVALAALWTGDRR